MMDNWMSMTSFGLAHWIFFVGMVALVLYPVGRILSRAGFSPFWALIIFVPIANLIGLWAFAFSDWAAKRSA